MSSQDSPLETGESTTVESEKKTKKPPMYQVMLYNDDFTPRDFVVLVLQGIFSLSSADAEQKMFHAHLHGKSVVGIYTYQMAETLVEQAHALAQKAEFPLMFSIEEI